MLTKFSSPIRRRLRKAVGRFLLLAGLLLLSTGTPRADAPAPSAPAPSLPWLAPAPMTNAAPSSDIEPIPKPPEVPPPHEALNLRPSPPPSPAADDVTPDSDAPRPFRFLHPSGQPDQLAAHLLVVYNANDPESQALAQYYAKRRNLPAERVMSIACSQGEEITRAEFDNTIRQPITTYLFQHHWMERTSQSVRLRDRSVSLLTATRNDIWAIVLMRGVPLKIAADKSIESTMQTDPALGSNAAAVDSELAMLPIVGLPLGGFVPNPFFAADGSVELRAGPELAVRLIFVTRLDGPTAADVHRVIDDTLAAETHRLAGEAVIDSRGYTDPKNGLTVGDVWMRKALDLLTGNGWPVTFDNRVETIPASEPLNQVALYFGWYIADANGPWITPPARFVPGAIAYHLQSYSADTVRSTTHNWVGPLISHGAAATMGCVYEPYLALTPHLDIFTRRLLKGDCFAEAAYASQVGLSWMTTVVGDPLYRPFQRPLDDALADAGPGPSDRRDWLLLQQVQQHGVTDRAGLLAALDVPGAGAIAHEHLGDLLQQLPDSRAGDDVERAYRHALELSRQPVDGIRIGLKLAHYYAAQKQEDRSQGELRALRDRYPADAAQFGVLERLPPPDKKQTRPGG